MLKILLIVFISTIQTINAGPWLCAACTSTACAPFIACPIAFGECVVASAFTTCSVPCAVPLP